MTKREIFIGKIVPGAQSAMKQCGWLASVTIAQAILESADGTSSLAAKYFNLFGIKGSGVSLPTKEVVGGKTIEITADFRVYKSWDESILDRSQMLLNAKKGDGTYRYRHLAGSTDSVFVANGLQKSGYATDPNYANLILQLIGQNDLTKYDKIVYGVSAFAESAWAWAIENKLIDGTRPNDPLTREEFATILQRFSNKK